MKRTRSFMITAIAILIIGGLVMSSCGRTQSRFRGKDHRQILEVENMQTYIGMSFDKRGSATVKDVTFVATDGYVYTQEFKDVSPYEGAIRWVPATEDDDFIKSRAISRWTGGAVNERLPEDCAEVLGVDVGYKDKSTRVKNLVYKSTDGSIYSREYKEGLVERHLVGWLEVRAK